MSASCELCAIACHPWVRWELLCCFLYPPPSYTVANLRNLYKHLHVPYTLAAALYHIKFEVEVPPGVTPYLTVAERMQKQKQQQGKLGQQEQEQQEQEQKGGDQEESKDGRNKKRKLDGRNNLAGNAGTDSKKLTKMMVSKYVAALALSLFLSPLLSLSLPLSVSACACVWGSFAVFICLSVSQSLNAHSPTCQLDQFLMS